ncbi:Germin-like protein subfamily 1 member 13 [Vitis vinifera]|uniref:Germin-like protein subfamily 1 member 13 n=1 Tax=Vitis vinifera TaxID=29760 RepID=A0A438F0D0_VITVI|nr:Germin-like protein subfamily 1 member 13 [Vitis vinifera]
MKKGVSFPGCCCPSWHWLPSLAAAFDPSPLQDTCVAIPEPKNAVFVNGKFCKNPNLTVAEDFFFQGLNIPGNTANRVGSNVTTVNVDAIPGLNTLGISLVRIDYAPYGLIHFQFNIGHTNAVAIAGLNSQNPGVITIANAVFGSNPPINPDFLARAFQLDKKIKIVIVGDSSLTMKKGVSSLVTVALMALASSLASAFDPRPLQDTCVAIDEPENAVFVNGKFCKNPNLTVADDFLYQGLNIPGNTANLVGSNVTITNVDVLPGQNTLGISLVRIDYAPYGQNPPHIHPVPVRSSLFWREHS